jgi:hypothetical protein
MPPSGRSLTRCYCSGGGDIFSVKNACDGADFTMRNYITTGAGSRAHAFNRCGNLLCACFLSLKNTKVAGYFRCDKFHTNCHRLTNPEAADLLLEMLGLVEVYREFPPLGPLINPFKKVPSYYPSIMRYYAPSVLPKYCTFQYSSRH